MMENIVMSKKERQQNNKFCLNLVDVFIEGFSYKYWKDYLLENKNVEYEPYWIRYQNQIERDAIWKRWNDIKTEIQKYYNKQELEDKQKAIEKAIEKIKCDIDKHAKFLRLEENATGFPVRKLEKCVEEEWMGKHHADLHISSFLEKFFGKKVRTVKYEIDTIRKEVEKIRQDASDKGFISYEWDKICKLADKNNYSCDTCYKKDYKILRQKNFDLGFVSKDDYYLNGCECKNWRVDRLCPIEIVRKFNEGASHGILNISGHDAININHFIKNMNWHIKKMKDNHQSAKSCWDKINRISPEWEIVPNTKRISIAISIFVVLILFLIIL